MLLNTVAGAVRQNPAHSQVIKNFIAFVFSSQSFPIIQKSSHFQDHHQRKQPEEDESSASELGSFLVNSLASKMLQPHH